MNTVKKYLKGLSDVSHAIEKRKEIEGQHWTYIFERRTIIYGERERG